MRVLIENLAGVNDMQSINWPESSKYDIWRQSHDEISIKSLLCRKKIKVLVPMRE